ncbi:MAG TPA: AMP-binding protein [Anaerolineae bacterium]|nr:AMP-binding protein [Anaerolineae bacterium]
MWNSSVETLTPEQLGALEDTALAKQFAHVRAHSAFYRAKFAGAERVTNRTELAALPFTEKDELRASQEAHPPFGDYLAASPDEIRRVHKTSGTTGRPLYIAMTERDGELTQECGARAYYASGLRRGDRVVHCLNYQLWAGGVTDHLALERVGATVIPFGVGNTQGLLRTIRDLEINAISSTPSYLVHLADIVRSELHIEPHELGLRKGFFGGEPGLQTPRVRENIERMWQIRAMDANYGLAEVLSIFGAECEVRDGLHFHGQGAVLVELIDPATRQTIPITDGASGELVYTNLAREAQPLMRYRSHDAAEIVSTEPCACGRTSFRFRVLGRSDDMVHVRGINVFPTAIADVLAGFPNELTGEFQIVLTTPPPYNELPLRVEYKATTLSDALTPLQDHIFHALQDHLNFRAALELVPLGTLPRSEHKTSRVLKKYT